MEQYSDFDRNLHHTTVITLFRSSFTSRNKVFLIFLATVSRICNSILGNKFSLVLKKKTLHAGIELYALGLHASD